MFQAAATILIPDLNFPTDHELLEKENWHHMRFGLEAALNYMNVSLNNTSTFGTQISKSAYIFSLSPGTGPPDAGNLINPGVFQGTFDAAPVGTFNPGSYEDIVNFDGTYPNPSALNCPPQLFLHRIILTPTCGAGASARMWNFR